MNRLKILFITIIIALAINVEAQEKENIRTLAVQGNGEISVKPDVANINFMLSSVNMDFEEAVDELNKKINKLTKSLKRAGIKKEEIYSSNYTIKKEYQHDYQNREKTFIGYKVSHSITLQTSADTKSVNKVFDALISSLKDVELTLSFGIKNTEQIKNELIKKAIEDAKQKASLMAQASGVKLLKIQTINYHSSPIHFRSGTNSMMVSKKMEADVVMVEDFNPAKIKQNTQVNIIWVIE
ncbi:MAG: SIMPL domain-containing protein [Bacteroidota bacterium]